MKTFKKILGIWLSIVLAGKFLRYLLLAFGVRDTEIGFWMVVIYVFGFALFAIIYFSVVFIAKPILERRKERNYK